MTTGLKVPLGVNPSGGAAVVEGDENDNKIISLALADDDNENAFQQDIGLGQRMVFDLNDPTIKPSILNRIVRIFDIFQAQKRYKLMPETILWEEISDKQELILSFRYINLESDEPRTFTRRFGAGG